MQMQKKDQIYTKLAKSMQKKANSDGGELKCGRSASGEVNDSLYVLWL